MIYYLDESQDKNWVMTALGIPGKSWNKAFSRIKQFRKYLYDKDGIRLAKELHATEFLAGRGNLGKNTVPKGRRAEIFKELLTLVSKMDDLGVECINVYVKDYEFALDRILNRINTSQRYKNSQTILVFDEGKELQIKRAMRKMRVYNPVPSMYGHWSDGFTKNITLKNIIADPFFRKSCDDYFIQVVDFIAYSLLRKEEPIPRIKKYGLEDSFCILEPILNKKAHKDDSLGVVRR